MPIFDTAFLIDLTVGEKGAAAIAAQVDRGYATAAQRLDNLGHQGRRSSYSSIRMQTLEVNRHLSGLKE